MSDNWTVANLENAFNIWNDKKVHYGILSKGINEGVWHFNKLFAFCNKLLQYFLRHISQRLKIFKNVI